MLEDWRAIELDDEGVVLVLEEGMSDTGMEEDLPVELGLGVSAEVRGGLTSRFGTGAGWAEGLNDGSWGGPGAGAGAGVPGAKSEGLTAAILGGLAASVDVAELAGGTVIRVAVRSAKGVVVRVGEELEVERL